MSIVRIETARGHRYEVDGQRTDGVTTILNKGIPKPALLPWGIKSVAEYAADHLDQLVSMRDEGMGREALVASLKSSPYAKRDEAAKRGTEVHKLAEDLLHGREVDVPAEIAGHVESCVRFLDAWRPLPIVSEVVVASRRWGYCGTLDLVAMLPDGEVILADWKTSKAMYGETALQLAAYRHAEVYLDPDGVEQPMEGLGITRTYGIHITANGYTVHELDTSEAVFKTFLYAAHIAATDLRSLVGPGMIELPERAA